MTPTTPIPNAARPAAVAEALPSIQLAEQVLHMEMVTERGKRARELARQVLASHDEALRYLRLIEHATAPGDDAAYHENAHELAQAALAALALPPEAPAAALRDWEITCDDCAGTGKVDHSEPLHVDGRYMGDDLFCIPCDTCLSCGVLVSMADIPKEIQR
jgi:hypothetical protein